ncbi:MAG TPA: hypothetical protein VFQ60_04430 [Patescibacteria group bacterium]|nr:hypothetical protein [Patescibacteria group bacterium]
MTKTRAFRIAWRWSAVLAGIVVLLQIWYYTQPNTVLFPSQSIEFKSMSYEELRGIFQPTCHTTNRHYVNDKPTDLPGNECETIELSSYSDELIDEWFLWQFRKDLPITIKLENPYLLSPIWNAPGVVFLTFAIMFVVYMGPRYLEFIGRQRQEKKAEPNEVVIGEGAYRAAEVNLPPQPAKPRINPLFASWVYSFPMGITFGLWLTSIGHPVAGVSLGLLTAGLGYLTPGAIIGILWMNIYFQGVALAIHTNILLGGVVIMIGTGLFMGWVAFIAYMHRPNGIADRMAKWISRTSRKPYHWLMGG